MEMHTTRPATFAAKRLVRLRKALGISQLVMGDHMGISGACVGAWERGRNPIPSWAARQFISAEQLVKESRTKAKAGVDGKTKR